MGTVTKRALVCAVAKACDCHQKTARDAVQSFLDRVVAELIAGNRIELRDFGVFEVKTRASRIGRNPRTGDQVPVPERRVVTFRPGKKMKELVATGSVDPSPDPPITVAPAPEAGTAETPTDPPLGGGGSPGAPTSF